MPPAMPIQSQPNLAETHEQLSGDIAHLRKLHRGLDRTMDVIRQGVRAYEHSLELLKRLRIADVSF